MRNFIITVDGKQYDVSVEEVTSGRTAASMADRPRSEEPAPRPAAPKAEGKGEKVLSPFPGLIKNLLVAEGATVAKDQPILVLEAMKMDNDITAPCAGTVSFAVAKGTNVESDAVLAYIS